MTPSSSAPAAWATAISGRSGGIRVDQPRERLLDPRRRRPRPQARNQARGARPISSARARRLGSAAADQQQVAGTVALREPSRDERPEAGGAAGDRGRCRRQGTSRRIVGGSPAEETDGTGGTTMAPSLSASSGSPEARAAASWPAGEPAAVGVDEGRSGRDARSWRLRTRPGTGAADRSGCSPSAVARALRVVTTRRAPASGSAASQALISSRARSAVAAAASGSGVS